MLSEMTNERLMKLNIDAEDWKDAVRQAAEPLCREGKIEPRYIDAIIQSAEEAGPYFVITPHVALPHARPEMGALACAIGVATLTHPVKFGNADNDPVKYLFCLSATDNETHLSALVNLAGLLEDEGFYQFLDNAQSPEEIMEYLKNNGM